MGGWLRHRPDGVGLTARATTQECTQIAENGLSVPFWGICVHCCDSRGSFERPWRRRSVHRSPKTASRGHFGAFVYTVATRVATRIATRAASGGTSASATMACRLRPLAGPSRLVGKTGSARVAPLPGWHLRRGVNPHEPPKSFDFLVILNLIGKHIQSFITIGPANRAFLKSLVFRVAVGVENERRRTQASPLEVLEVPGRCYTVIRSRFWKGHHASSIAKSTAR